ncbi:hypothetical protein CASFOL_009745 [Castilleja foliolosa]|uniref:ZF-HD dimerization-type domain-containing protein n=1 Tax=Castilleja foliolosa TaxID=1961234 RepID=A0ABD3DQJ0_9LAMI
MDLDLTPNTNSTKSPDDSETDTPPHTAQPIKLLSYTNAAQKNNHPPPPPAYKECMKNHAANIGGHAVDGCGEFLPPGGGGPVSLKCAACGCHRSFHRREPESPTAITPPFLNFRHPSLQKRFSISPPGAVTVPYNASPLFFGLRTGEEHHQAPVTPTAENSAGRKRFRTKFSQEQKEKMQSFSVKLGWKLQKCDEGAVKEFCSEIGVTKGVLKVWMHNNKNTIGKKETNNGGLIGFDDEKINCSRKSEERMNDNGSSSSA